ncbi:MAG TPA: ABC transporter ATP-binding protein [Vicinamibacterales bacterium]|jgi:ATP-binding cassette subfamily B protein|nr:ABC transporter ATP-binding protein [Vicinamibacterales bacterium]
MSPAKETDRDPQRLSKALQLVVRRYVAQVRCRPWTAVPALILPGVGNIFIFYAPALVVARLLDAFSRRGDLSARELTPYVLTFAALWLVGEMVWRVGVHFIMRAEIQGMEALYIEAMDELLAKDLTFFQNNYAGSLTKRALGYARRFEDVFDVFAFSVFANLVPLVFVGVILWRYSPLLVISLVVLLAATCGLVLPFIRRRQRLVDAREAASNVLAGHVADSIANAEAVRAFAREPEEAAIHAKNVRDYGKKTLQSWDYQNLRVDMITSPMAVVTNTVGLVIALATRPAGAGIEGVLVTFSYYSVITRIMWEFNRVYRGLESSITDAAQFTELLLDPPTVVDATPVGVFAPRHSGIEISDVRFRHSAAQPLLFDRFSLEVAPGSTLGLVGRSGGGKTTLTRLLLRFSDVEDGRIFLGCQAIDRIPQAALRKTIAYVPQDPAMFHRSIADNIRIGRPNATEAEVRNAARLAHASEFIETLPLGYDTLVGERGVKLSGGQRQRVAIARAILKDAPILILDEATSSLDSESEALIQEALWTLMARRTSIVIAHRLSTVRRLDRLIVLDGGAIVEDGTHTSLLAQNGIYSSLWSHQSGGFLSSTYVEESAARLSAEESAV